MGNLCNICKRPMGDLNDATTEDCGGDCLKCMAELVQDPDCMLGMLKIYSTEIERLCHHLENMIDIAINYMPQNRPSIPHDYEPYDQDLADIAVARSALQPKEKNQND
jgi:hypothetical protein